MADSSNLVILETRSRELDELRLIRAAREDPKAFGELYMLYVEPVFRYLYSRVGNVHEAEDITAQTFLVAYEAFDRFREDRHFASWLFTIARNKAMDHFRQRTPLSSMDAAADLPVENDPLNGVLQLEQLTVLSKLIQALPEDDRELLRLRFLAAMSFPELAHILRRNEGAVKKSIYRLLARLHRQLEVSNE
jgi:RNA polymerase sigma-70 factor (ECF subfamily)